MDDQYAPRPIAGWFTAAAVASLLFMALGCVMYLMSVLADPATLPLDQQAARAATPAWVTGANAVAVWVGLAGTILLVMRRKLAELLIGISLVAVLVMLAGLLVVEPLRETASAGDLAVVIVVAAITWTIFWFARHSRQRGWLR
ncbi:MAG TPA: hypothetical protein VFP57_06915 [Sphingomicrobium sp.]|jgi:hypothetical protein|nr:hypothetical protein [Sphingomicrobium sp.]